MIIKGKLKEVSESVLVEENEWSLDLKDSRKYNAKVLKRSFI
jgi:hypothetical protein